MIKSQTTFTRICLLFIAGFLLVFSISQAHAQDNSNGFFSDEYVIKKNTKDRLPNPASKRDSQNLNDIIKKEIKTLVKSHYQSNKSSLPRRNTATRTRPESSDNTTSNDSGQMNQLRQALQKLHASSEAHDEKNNKTSLQREITPAIHDNEAEFASQLNGSSPKSPLVNTNNVARNTVVSLVLSNSSKQHLTHHIELFARLYKRCKFSPGRLVLVFPSMNPFNILDSGMFSAETGTNLGLLSNGGISIDIRASVPKHLKLTSSPSWIIQHKGTTFIFDGYNNINQFFAGTGEFLVDRANEEKSKH